MEVQRGRGCFAPMDLRYKRNQILVKPLVVSFLANINPPTGTEKNGEPPTSKYCENAGRPTSTNTEGTREAGQSNCGPARTEWNRFDAIAERQEAHDVRYRTPKNSQSSKGAVGEGEGGEEGKELTTVRWNKAS